MKVKLITRRYPDELENSINEFLDTISGTIFAMHYQQSREIYPVSTMAHRQGEIDTRYSCLIQYQPNKQTT